MLVRTLERKAKAAGGELIEVTTWNTRLSQFDHTTGQYTKKPLSQREHVFGDGVTEPVQRDLYSAFLVFLLPSKYPRHPPGSKGLAKCGTALATGDVEVFPICGLTRIFD